MKSTEEIWNEKIQAGISLDKLMNTPEFKQIIQTTYISDGIGKYTSQLVAEDKDRRKTAIKHLEAIGSLTAFFKTIKQDAQEGLEAMQ